MTRLAIGRRRGEIATSRRRCSSFSPQLQLLLSLTIIAALIILFLFYCTVDPNYLSDAVQHVLLTNNDNPPADTAEHRPRVLYTVFAGRKNRLLLQEPYWKEMHALGAISEIHLWNYIRRDDNPENAKQRQHLRQLQSKYSFISIKEPSDIPMPETYWYDRIHSLNSTEDFLEEYEDGRALLRNPNRRGYSEYYRYYAKISPWDGVIIKADDDIVYVNSTMVRPYAQFLWNRTDIFLLSASVINQGLCAYHQQRLGAIPTSVDVFEWPPNGMGALQVNGTMALHLHEYFLASEENRQRFYLTEPQFIPYETSYNINFIALRGEAFAESWELIQEKLRSEEKYYDEGAITRDAVRKNKREGIYMPLVVAHASFSHQYKLHHEILSMWADWAKKERSDIYGDLLDEWVPPKPYKIKGMAINFITKKHGGLVRTQTIK